jgi:hypothetical protein
MVERSAPAGRHTVPSYQVPHDDMAGVGVSVSTRRSGDSAWIAMDFLSTAGDHRGHDLTPQQAVALIEALTLALADLTG